MITNRFGDMLDDNTLSNILINPVNCVGVMGKGLALQFKNKFGEEYFKDYVEQCELHYINVSGELYMDDETSYNIKNKFGFIDNYPVYKNHETYIYNFATKTHYNKPSALSFIDNNLGILKSYIEVMCIDNCELSVSIPPLGCGLGGLDIKMVYTLIKNKLNKINCNIYLWNFKNCI